MDNATPVVVKAAPSPKSPPRYPDFCGRRRLQLEVQILNREIGFLEDELQSLEGLEPVSRCCKEVEEFVGSNPDPLIPIDKKRQQSCLFWNWLRSIFCFPISQFCCHCCCQKRRCCRDCSSHKDCSCCNYESRCPHCAVEYPCCQYKCAECSPCACFEPRCDSAGSCSCPCHCFRLPSCGIRRCKLSCYPFRCCGRRRSETPCCSMPQCAPCDPSPCMPWTWRCCCCCNPLHHCCCCRREASCPLPRPLCPDLSCGCVWSCPKCTEARLCRSCCSGKSSCITGCLC